MVGAAQTGRATTDAAQHPRSLAPLPGASPPLLHRCTLTHAPHAPPPTARTTASLPEASESGESGVSMPSTGANSTAGDSSGSDSSHPKE